MEEELTVIDPTVFPHDYDYIRETALINLDKTHIALAYWTILGREAHMNVWSCPVSKEGAAVTIIDKWLQLKRELPVFTAVAPIKEIPEDYQQDWRFFYG